MVRYQVSIEITVFVVVFLSDNVGLAVDFGNLNGVGLDIEVLFVCDFEYNLITHRLKLLLGKTMIHR